MLQNCTKYTSPAPTTLALPTFTELYQLYRSFTYHSCRPYCYRTVQTIPDIYLQHSPPYSYRTVPTTPVLYLQHSPPYSYRTVPTTPVLYLQHLPSLLLQNCANFTSPVPTTLALPTFTELYQQYRSFTYHSRPPYCVRAVPTTPVIYLQHLPPYCYITVPTIPGLYLQHSLSLLLQNCTNYTTPVPAPLSLPAVTELYQLYHSCAYTTLPAFSYRTVQNILFPFLQHTPSLLLRICTNFTSPVPTPLALPI